MGKLLEIKNLHVHYNMRDYLVKAVNGVDLSINEGETLGVVGETGAGKTTMALSVLRLVQKPQGVIDNGDIIFKGRNLNSLNEMEMRKIRGNQISMIFQDPMTSLNPVLPVGEQVSEVIRLHNKISRVDSSVKTAEIMELVGIPASRLNEYPHQFSGGMKQRVVIAIALACSPSLIIADEPTTALDVTIQAQVLELMEQLKTRFKTSIMLITHDLGVVSELCDRVAIMYAGEILELGSIVDVYDNMSHPYTVGLFGSIPTLDKTVERLTPIMGNMPDPTNLPTGCSFSPRCPKSMQICCDIKPEVVEVSPCHYVKCHLFMDVKNG